MLNYVVASSVLTEAMKGIMTTAFTDVKDTIVDVMGIYVPVAVGAVVLVASVSFAIKKLKGVLSSAS